MTRPVRFVFAFLLLRFVEAGCLIDQSDAQPDSAPIFSLSCRDAGVRHILGALAIQNEISIAGLDGIPKSLTVTPSLYDVDFEAGLLAVLEPVGFTFDVRDGIYFIRKQPPLSYRLSLDVAAGVLTLAADGVDVTTVIRALSETGISITSTANLAGTITAYLQAQPINTALPMLFASFTLHQTDGIYTVGPKIPVGQSDFHLMTTDGGGEPRVSVTARNHALTELLSELAHRAKINLSVSL